MHMLPSVLKHHKNCKSDLHVALCNNIPRHDHTHLQSINLTASAAKRIDHSKDLLVMSGYDSHWATRVQAGIMAWNYRHNYWITRLMSSCLREHCFLLSLERKVWPKTLSLSLSRERERDGYGHWSLLLFPDRTFHKSSKMIMAVKVLALDATPEEQKQIKSELEILHKVSLESNQTTM